MGERAHSLHFGRHPDVSHAPLDFAVSRDRLGNAVNRAVSPSPGMFPLWPVNRFFANFDRAGGQIERLLRQAGVHAGDLVSIDAEIPAAELVRLIRRIRWLARDELWGLRPRPTQLGGFSQACRLAVQAESVGGALRAGFRFYHGQIDDFTLRVTRDDDSARLTLIDTLPDRPGRDMLHVVVLQVLRVVIEWLSGRIGFIEHVEFRYPPIPRVELLEAVFRAPIVSSTAHTSLVIDATMLVRPVVAEARHVGRFAASIPGELALVVQGQRTIAERAAGYIHARGD